MFEGLVAHKPGRRVGEIEIFAAREASTGAEVEAHVFACLDPDAQVAWFRRVREISLIRNPGLQAIEHLGRRGDGAPYFVVSAQPGVSLAERLERDGPLAGSQVRAIADQLMTSLGVAHQHGVVHSGLALDSCICIDTSAGGETILLCGLATTGVVRTSELIQADIGALCTLLMRLFDASSEPALAVAMERGAVCDDLVSLAQVLDHTRGSRLGHRKPFVVAGALVGLMASAFGVSWWLTQR